jgi:hypothetical protein
MYVIPIFKCDNGTVEVVKVCLRNSPHTQAPGHEGKDPHILNLVII